MLDLLFVCFKQKTSYEVRISDWSSGVCSSDLIDPGLFGSVGGQGYGNAVVGFIDVLNQVIAIDTQAPGIDMDAALIQTQVLLVRLVGHVEHHVFRRHIRLVGEAQQSSIISVRDAQARTSTRLNSSH